LRLKPMIAALRETGGAAVAVGEAEIVAALRRLCGAGLFVEPTSATPAAALDDLVARGAIQPRETTVVVLSGSGLKAAATVADLCAGPGFPG
jgi:threonine synthase